jgi:hypothetical protein
MMDTFEVTTWQDFCFGIGLRLFLSPITKTPVRRINMG